MQSQKQIHYHKLHLFMLVLHQMIEKLSFCFDPLQLKLSLSFLEVKYFCSLGVTCSVTEILLSLEGFVKFPESSMQSENFLAIFDRIFHISTSFFYKLTPSDHFYSYSSNTGTVQFHDLALFCHRNFSNFDEDLLVNFLTISLSFRKLFIASHTDPTADTGGSLSIMALGCSASILCSAIVYSFNCFSNSTILLSLILISSLSLVFSSLKITSLSRISEMCFLVGDLASCSNLSFSDNRLIYAWRSVMMISYFLLVLASLYLIHRFMDPSNSEIIDPALLQRLVKFGVSYCCCSYCFLLGEFLLQVMQSITVSRNRLLPVICVKFQGCSDMGLL